MDYFIPPINYNSMQSNMPYAASSANNIDPKIAADAFTSVFLRSMLKEVFENKNINNSAIAPEMLMDKIISQISESDAFGLKAALFDQNKYLSENKD